MTGLPHSVIRRTIAIAMALSTCAVASTAAAIDLVSIDRPEVNMRAGPGTDQKGLWVLRRGYPLQVLGRQGNWLKVRDFERDEGWVYRPLTGAKPHFIVKTSTANIRSGPGTRYRKVGEARYGEVLRTEERREDWVKVTQEGGLKGWVARRLLWGW